ncbi:hypothetical protein PL111_0697 [Leuconostoc inhae]|uniref:Uncharacterized protein n=2 Tax=Leuconostoc TaxID=1243 RepID=A0AAN2UEH9_9LACO|nr:hypothetical protein PL111_0697 [Leuconostoc inhae]
MAFFEPPTVLIGVVLNHTCQDCVWGTGGVLNPLKLTVALYELF